MADLSPSRSAADYRQLLTEMTDWWYKAVIFGRQILTLAYTMNQAMDHWVGFRQIRQHVLHYHLYKGYVNEFVREFAFANRLCPKICEIGVYVMEVAMEYSVRLSDAS